MTTTCIEGRSIAQIMAATEGLAVTEKPVKCCHFGSNHNHQKRLEKTLHNQSEPQLLKISCDSWLLRVVGKRYTKLEVLQ